MLCGDHLRCTFVQTVGELSEQSQHWFFCWNANTSLSHICILTAAGQIKWEPVIENSTAVVKGTRKWQDSSWCHYLKTDMYSSPSIPGFITWVFLYISFSILYSTPFLISGTNCVPPPTPAPPPLLFPLIPYLHPQRDCLSLNRRKHGFRWSAPCPYYQSMTRSCTVNLSD